MRTLILLLIFCAGFQAAAFNPGKYFSNLMCSDEHRAEVEEALFPTDGSDSFYQKKLRDPNKWYSMDRQTMKEYCWAFRTSFHKIRYKGIGRHWECGHLVYRCYYDSDDDDNDSNQKTNDNNEEPSDNGGGPNDETQDDDGGGPNDETPNDDGGVPGDPDAA